MDADVEVGNSETTQKRPESLTGRIAIVIGSIGLVAAMAIDSIAVVGRHVGFSVLGSIELVQAAIVLIASSSIVLATIHRQHASVHIVTERLRPETATKLARVANLLAALLGVLLAIGGIWLIAELWNGHERSEILHVPYRVLRIIFVVSIVMLAGLFVRNMRARGEG